MIPKVVLETKKGVSLVQWFSLIRGIQKKGGHLENLLGVTNNHPQKTCRGQFAG